MFILGTDIGYSNLKSAKGPADVGVPTTAAWPATAAPLDCYADDSFLVGGRHGASTDVMQVLVNDQPWVVGAAPECLHG